MSDETFFALEGSEVELSSPGFGPFNANNATTTFAALGSVQGAGGAGGVQGGVTQERQKVWEMYASKPSGLGTQSTGEKWYAGGAGGSGAGSSAGGGGDQSMSYDADESANMSDIYGGDVSAYGGETTYELSYVTDPSASSGGGYAGEGSTNAGYNGEPEAEDSTPNVSRIVSRSGSSSSLQRRPSLSQRRRSRSQGSLRSQRSLKSQRSQLSQKSQAPGQGSSTPGHGHGHGHVPPRLGQHHKHSGSVTSLESIPEASPAPGAVLDAAILRGEAGRKGPAAASSGRGVVAGGSGHGHSQSTSSVGHSSAQSHLTSRTDPTSGGGGGGSSSGFGAGSSSGGGHIPQLPPLRNQTAPPRLSIALHQHSDSLSEWSEALLTGISDLGSGSAGSGGSAGGGGGGGIGGGLTFDDLIGRNASGSTGGAGGSGSGNNTVGAGGSKSKPGPSPLGLSLGQGLGLGGSFGGEKEKEKEAPMSAPVSGSTVVGMRGQQKKAQGSRLRQKESGSSLGHSEESERETEREKEAGRERNVAGAAKTTGKGHERNKSTSAERERSRERAMGAVSPMNTTPTRPIRKPGQPLPSSKPPPKVPAPLPPVGASAASSTTSLPSTSQAQPKTDPTPTTPKTLARKATLGASSSASSSTSSLTHAASNPNGNGASSTSPANSPTYIQPKGPVGGHIQATINKINERHGSVSSSGHGHPGSSSGAAGGSAPMSREKELPTPLEQQALGQQPMRLMPTLPTPFSPAIMSPGVGMFNTNKPLPSPIPLGLGQSTMPGGGGRHPLPALPSAPPTSNVFKPFGANANALPPQHEGLLSPPPTAFKSPGVTSPGIGIGVLSPASSGGPDSAQLWNEIEQMMDPGMMANIPGLHLSVALPQGAREVLRSAGIGGASQAQLQAESERVKEAMEAERGRELRTVHDLVGDSPPASPFAVNGSDYGDDVEEEEEEEGMYERPATSQSQRVVSTKPIEPLSLRPGRSMSVSRDGGPSGSRALPTVDVHGPGRVASSSRSRETDEAEDDDAEEDYDRLGADLSTRVGSGSYEDRMVNRDSSRSSTSTITAMAHTTIVRNVSIARRAGAYVIGSGGRSPVSPVMPAVKPTPSPPSGGSSEEGGSGSGSRSSGSISIEHATPTTDTGIASPLLYYLDGTQTPSPNPEKMFDQSGGPLSAKMRRDTREDDEDQERGLAYDDDSLDVDGYYSQDLDYPEETAMQAPISAGGSTPSRPTIIISDAPPSATTGELTALGTGIATPLSPFQRYRGWLSDVVAPLEEFIDEQVDPREHYLDLNEIAEGESGSVFAATLNPENTDKLRLSDLVRQLDADELATEDLKMVAIKSIAIVPSGSPKLVDLQKELSLMKGLWHENVLGMDAVYVDLVEDSLWVRMELMERSLADVIALVENGLMLQERMFARFASDVLLALDYLQQHDIGHRDVRSDNLLLNKHGVLKLADFSNAVQVTPQNPLRDEVLGVAFWQAPEIRRGLYNVLKVDVWSLGATVWEMAETQPPFADTKQLADRWPPLTQPELYSPQFHDFLRKCSEPSASRPTAGDLLKSPFVNNACGRPVIVQLLSQCMAIEKLLQDQDDES